MHASEQAGSVKPAPAPVVAAVRKPPPAPPPDWLLVLLRVLGAVHT